MIQKLEKSKFCLWFLMAYKRGRILAGYAGVMGVLE